MMRIAWSKGGRKSTGAKLLVLALVCTASVLAWVSAAAGAGVIFVVKNLADAGTGSLRDAITKANANAGKDTIVFKITGTITVATPLPAITDPVVIDARTISGFAGTPLIRIDNGTGSSSAIGLDVTAGSSKIGGLDITSFGEGIVLETGGTNTIVGNWIGIDTSGAAAGNSVAGIAIRGSSAGNTIGGLSTAARNVVSGNPGVGISIGGTGNETANVVEGDYIGTSPTGAGARPNGTGVLVRDANANTIGGFVDAARNVISGNTHDGVVLDGGGTTNNSIAGDYIGSNAAGTAALPNGGNGVLVSGGASANQIGRSKGHNVISGNTGSGVAVTGASTDANRVLGNLIGLDPAGSKAVPNGGDGVTVTGGVHATVGGATVDVRNVIAGNAGSGVRISGTAAIAASVIGDYIGTDATGTVAVPNGANGVTIEAGSQDNRIGEQTLNGAPVPGASSAKGNLISGNAGSGVLISGTGGATTNNYVFGSFIGTNAAGTAALPNGQDGVLIDGAGGNVIGGAPQQGGGASAGRNVISGNKQMGVRIHGAASVGNKVKDDFIGTDASGTAALANGRYGVVVESGASGNSIGTSLGTYPNVISGNGVSGVIVRGSGTDSNVVAGSYIGTGAGGTAAVPNVSNGVEVAGGATNTTIGGNAAGLRNIISGNGGSGIRAGSGTTGTRVVGNFVGTDAAGTGALANAGNGVLFAGSSGNVVGGLSAALSNTIMFNGVAGVKVDATGGTAKADEIVGNSIDQNGALGIDLLAGANDGIAAPTITSVATATSTNVKATFTGAASTAYRFEVFSSPACDPSGAGEGATLLGAKTVTTAADGSASFSILVSPVPAGQALTETATRQDVLETSEFSTCATAP